jgi:hypothetical protein
MVLIPPSCPTHQRRKGQAMKHHDPFEGFDLATHKSGPLPYYDPIPALIRNAERVFNVLVRFGIHGVYIVKRPSDEVMNKIKKA